MSSSTPIRFLLDENVRIELAAFLSERAIDFTEAAKASGDRALAAVSLNEGRVIVTNDRDFSKMCNGEVFGVVWLRLPQSDPALLIEKFGAMLDDHSMPYADSLIVLDAKKRHTSEPLLPPSTAKNS